MTSSFDYAVVRIVPRVERGEFVNAGVILFCRARRFLGARVALNEERLRALAPWIDPKEVREHLAVIPLVTAPLDSSISRAASTGWSPPAAPLSRRRRSIQASVPIQPPCWTTSSAHWWKCFHCLNQRIDLARSTLWRHRMPLFRITLLFATIS